MPSNEKFFHLNENERIVYESRPENSYRWLAMIDAFKLNVFYSILLMLSILILPLEFQKYLIMQSGVNYLDFAAFVVFGSFLLSVAISILQGNLMYRKRYHWITSTRIVVKTGFIGYSVKSIPLERISYVQTTMSFIERVFGVTGLNVKAIADQKLFDGSISGIPDSGAVQSIVMELLKHRRVEAGVTF